jgi:hypothetical protein
MNIAWRHDAMSIRHTRVPRCGSTSTKPQPAERLRDGKARDAEALADRLLLDELAGREGEGDDRLADGVLDALHGAAASVPRQGTKERIG